MPSLPTLNLLTGRGWLLLLLWLLVAPPAARAQAPAWQAAATVLSGIGGASTASATATDAAGNVYVAGIFSGTATFGATVLTSVGSTDLYVAKWNPTTKAYLWAVRAGGNRETVVQALAVQGTNLYLTGSFNGPTTTWGATVLTNANTSATGTGFTDAFLAKLTDNGTAASFGWVRRMGGSGNDAGYTLAVSGTSLYVGGKYSISTTGFGPTVLYPLGEAGFVAKFTDGGAAESFNWLYGVGAGVLPAANDLVTKVAVKGSSVYAVGSFASRAFFSTPAVVSYTSVGGDDGFLVKLTDQGNTVDPVWVTSQTGTGDSQGQALAVKDNAVYIAGNYNQSPLTIGNTVLNELGLGDIYLAKYVDQGTTASLAWAMRAGGPVTDGAQELAANGSKVYLASYFAYNAYFPLSPNSATYGTTTVRSAGGSDVALSRLTDAGSSATFDWTQQAGSNTDDFPNALALGGKNAYVVGGFAGPTIAFGTTVLTNLRTDNQASFVAVLPDQDLLAAAGPARLPGPGCYPNPAHATTTVPVPTASGPATLTLLDALGRVVRTATAPAGQDYPLDLTSLAPGVYALRVQAGEAEATQRLVVE